MGRHPLQRKARTRQPPASPRAAARSRSAEGELERFFALTLDMLCVAGFDGYFKRLNPAWQRTLGYSDRELLARPYLDLVHPDDRAATAAAAAKLAAGADVVTFENRYRAKVGTYKWLLWTSRSVPDQKLIFAAARNITDRKLAEEKLHRFTEEIRDLYNNAPCGYHSLDPHGVFIRINDTELAWLGYSREELLDKKKITDVITPASRQTFAHNFPRFKQRGRVRDLEFEMVRKDGSVFPVLLNATAVTDRRGRFVMSRSTAVDLTERKLLERMKDEFIAMVSHELRTPLASLRGALGLLAGGQLGDLNPRGQRMLEIAVEDTDRLIRLVNDILEIERMELGRVKMQLQPCSAADLVRRAAETVRPLAEKAGVSLRVSVRPAPLRADPDRLQQALTNLLSNAIKFSPPGANVWLSAEPADRHVLFQVRDQGRGIPAQQLESIFDRFRQVEVDDARVRGGAGLGLSICRLIVQQHGGRIWAESRPEQGSAFFFTIPAGRKAKDKRRAKRRAEAN